MKTLRDLTYACLTCANPILHALSCPTTVTVPSGVHAVPLHAFMESLMNETLPLSFLLLERP